MSVNIVTGFTGRAHITSDDDRIRNAAYVGTDKFVMPFGHQFEAEVQNNNLIRIKDGMLMNQGTQMGIELTDYEDVVIENGLSGTNRNDLIVMRYEKQEDTGLESASLVVIKGTSGATASDPTYISGNILDGGALIDDYPLYRVKIKSLSIVAVQQLFSVREDVGSEMHRIERAFDSKMDKTNPTGTESLSLNRKANTNVGGNSVAVNSYNTASGTASFASGENTTARGNASFASGENTIAGGLDSHAEGYNTIASGYASHAEGIGTTAGYQNQTVVGIYNDNNSSNLFEIGNGTSSSNRSNALEVRQNGDVHAGGDFYDGDGNKVGGDITGKMDKNNPTGTGSLSMNRKASTTVGDYSVAEGSGTTASGRYSHAEGNSTTASGASSHAEGTNTTANNTYSHAEGDFTTARGISSHAEGQNTTAIGDYSHAGGNHTIAGYQNQTVIGKYNENSSSNLFEIGNGTDSSHRSNALEVRQNGDVYAGGDFYDGDGNKVGGDITSKMEKNNPTGTGSLSLNRKENTTVGVLSATVNENNTASGDGSFASGHNNTASGLYSNASGTSTTASGSYSHAEGNNTTASGDRSHAEGDSTTAGGSCSHSEGESTTASGRASHAEGMNTTASGTRSHAAGYWTTAGYSNQTVVGKYNNNKETNLFEVGNGISGNSKSNAFEVSESGNAIAGADLLYDGHKRITGSYANDILVECTDLELGPDNTITGRDEDNVPIHSGTYDLKVGSIIYVPEDLHFGMNVPAGLYEVLYLVDGGNDISYLSFGDYQRDEPDPAHVKYMPKSLEERIETDLEIVEDTLGYKKINLLDVYTLSSDSVGTLTPINKGEIQCANKTGAWYQGITNTLKLEPNKTYTLSCKGTINGAIYLGTGSASGNETYISAENTTVSKTGITDSDGNINVWFLCNHEGESISFSYYDIQLERGSEVTPYQEYIGSVDERLSTNKTSLSTTKTATGNPISVSDSAHVNAEELKVELKPIQDLHGYDKPWVGGAGKNKIPLTVDGIKSANTSGTWSGNVYALNGVTFTIMTDSDGNVTGIKANGTANPQAIFNIQNTYIQNEFKGMKLNGCAENSNGINIIIQYSNNGTSLANEARQKNGQDLVISSEYNYCMIGLIIGAGYSASNVIFYPMLRLATETDPTYEPYSNICPISGYDETSVVVKDTADNPTVTDTYTLQFGDTVYGAEVDFVRGVATVTKGYIAEYAGETLPSTWISDRDVYASGTTPTTGAQVVYKLATPYTIQLTPQQIKMLKGNNVLVADGEMDLEYQVDSVVGDVKESIEKEIENLPKELPNSPTEQGAYTLQCTVDSEGNASFSWVSA